MMWSFSTSRMFQQCQRRWYYDEIFASSKANDPRRREAHRLSKLQSIHAWRGHIVDEVISQELVPKLNQRRSLTIPEMLRAARIRFDRGRVYAHDRGADGPHFRAVEYGSAITDEEFDAAWKDIETGIRNLFALDELRRTLKDSKYLVAQRPLVFHVGDVSVRGVPDLIAFTKSNPIIVDWKVHFFPVRDYRLQLALYAVALSRASRHRDFPSVSPSPTDIRLLEAQLLTGELRTHEVTDDDVDAVESHVAATAWQMQRAIDGIAPSKLRPDDFPVTRYPESCEQCSFRRLCWERIDAA